MIVCIRFACVIFTKLSFFTLKHLNNDVTSPRFFFILYFFVCLVRSFIEFEQKQKVIFVVFCFKTKFYEILKHRWYPMHLVKTLNVVYRFVAEMGKHQISLAPILFCYYASKICNWRSFFREKTFYVISRVFIDLLIHLKLKNFAYETIIIVIGRSVAFNQIW